MTENDRIRVIARQMADDVERFDGQGSALDDLSFSLKANLTSLEQAGADQAWVEELRSLRNEIEVVNAFFIESGRPRLNDEERRQLGEILGELRQALIEY